jgi:hypothetical protein
MNFFKAFLFFSTCVRRVQVRAWCVSGAKGRRERLESVRHERCRVGPKYARQARGAWHQSTKAQGTKARPAPSWFFLCLITPLCLFIWRVVWGVVWEGRCNKVLSSGPVPSSPRTPPTRWNLEGNIIITTRTAHGEALIVRGTG